LNREVRLTGRRSLPAALALALLASAGCSSDDPDGVETRPSAPVSASVPAPSTDAPSMSAEPEGMSADELVEKVLVTDADLTDGGRVETRADGTQVEGFVTLDNCGFVFTSEANRTARRQVNMSSAGADAFSHEVVAYTDEAAARDALEELRESVRTCPSGEPVPSVLSSVPVVYEVLGFDERATGFPVDDVAVLVERVSSPDHPTFYSVAIYQRAGSVLNAVYVGGEEPPSRRLRKEQRRLAVVTGARLASAVATAT
jgi:hypothetical protein